MCKCIDQCECTGECMPVQPAQHDAYLMQALAERDFNSDTADQQAAAVLRAREECAKIADDQWVKDPNISAGDAIRVRSSK